MRQVVGDRQDFVARPPQHPRLGDVHGVDGQAQAAGHGGRVFAVRPNPSKAAYVDASNSPRTRAWATLRTCRLNPSNQTGSVPAVPTCSNSSSGGKPAGAAGWRRALAQCLRNKLCDTRPSQPRN